MWEEGFDHLFTYKEDFGNCDVPSKFVCNDGYKLRVWVDTQRSSFRQNSLSSEQVKRLNSLEFDWNPRDTTWRKMYEKLVTYKKDNGHCNVPRNYEPEPQLGGWVVKQRVKIRNGSLDDVYLELLKRIKFM